MKHSEAFDIIVAEFSEDMATVRVRKPNSFIAVTSGGKEYFIRVGKTAAGRHLDGRTWDETPPVVSLAGQLETRTSPDA